VKIAITIWGNRISPVFDSAKTLLITEIKNGMIQKKTYQSFDPHAVHDLLKTLKEQNISTLICGAISTHPAELIVENDIKLISFVMGNTLEFLENFTDKNQIKKSFIMPGCRHHKNFIQPTHNRINTTSGI